jgi:hypothetical protein
MRSLNDRITGLLLSRTGYAVNEQEWLTCTDPGQMLEFLRDKASQRKLRLFACACCRRIWHLLPSEACKQAVRAAELYADGLIGEQERREAAKGAVEAYVCSAAAAEVVLQATWHPLDGLAAEHPREEYEERYERAYEEARLTPSDACEAWAASEAACAAYYSLLIDDVRLPAVSLVAAHAAHYFYEEDGWEAYCTRGSGDEDERAAQRRIVDDIFGNPFRPVTVDPSWFTSTVLCLAQAVYSEVAFDRLPILADALEDAGCDDAEILNHCRSEGPHVKGCWVADLLLGKD